MEEQEGINLETVNLGTGDSINLPIEEEQTTEPVANDDVVENLNIEVDEEKESLKKGINAERKARKEAEKKAKELEARILALENASKTPEKSTLEKLMESGVDESIAKSIVNAIDEKQTGSKKVEQELANMKFRNELLEKSKDSNFSDIVDYEDEIKNLVDKGLTLEQSYYAINYEKSKNLNTNSEITRKVEAKLQNNQARKQILGNINSNAGVVANTDSNAVKATATEIAMARMAGIDINDYLAAKNADSIKQYDNYINKKKK